MLTRIWMILWKEFIQISRDPRMLIIVAVLPIFMLLLYGYAIDLDVRDVRFGVYDADHSQASRQLTEAFTRSGYFELTAYPTGYREVERVIDHGTARVVLVIPVNYSERLADGLTSPVQLIVDGSDSTTASTAISYAAGILEEQSAKATLQAIQRVSGLPIENFRAIDHRARYWYNPELRSRNFTVPGLIAIILMVLSALLTSVTVVRERERGTIEQLVVSPVRPFELMIGKLAPYVLIAFGDVVLVLVLSVFLFHVPLVGSPLLVLGCSAFFVVAALGIGLFISTIANNQQTAMLGAIMATQLPTVLLSGFIFPITSMPKAIQVVTLLIPASHFIKILRAIFLKGSGFGDLWVPAVVLLLFGAAMIAFCTVRFKKRV